MSIFYGKRYQHKKKKSGEKKSYRHQNDLSGKYISIFFKYISILFWKTTDCGLKVKIYGKISAFLSQMVSSPLGQKLHRKGLALFLDGREAWKQALLFSCTLEWLSCKEHRNTLKKLHGLYLSWSLAKEENEETVQKFSCVKAKSNTRSTASGWDCALPC